MDNYGAGEKMMITCAREVRSYSSRPDVPCAAAAAPGRVEINRNFAAERAETFHVGVEIANRQDVRPAVDGFLKERLRKLVGAVLRFNTAQRSSGLIAGYKEWCTRGHACSLNETILFRWAFIVLILSPNLPGTRAGSEMCRDTPVHGET